MAVNKFISENLGKQPYRKTSTCTAPLKALSRLIFQINVLSAVVCGFRQSVCTFTSEQVTSHGASFIACHSSVRSFAMVCLGVSTITGSNSLGITEETENSMYDERHYWSQLFRVQIKHAERAWKFAKPCYS